MGQIWLWNLGFMAELWGKNSATDNPPRPMILIPAHTPSAHASSGFRLQVSFRAVFGWGRNSYAFIKLSVCRPPYTLSESTFPYKHPRAAPLASMRCRRSLHGIPRSSLLPTSIDQHTTTPPTLMSTLITPAGMGCRRRPGPAGSPGRILVRIPGVGVRAGVGR